MKDRGMLVCFRILLKPCRQLFVEPRANQKIKGQRPHAGSASVGGPFWLSNARPLSSHRFQKWLGMTCCCCSCCSGGGCGG